jgi:hypothetical protein
MALLYVKELNMNYDNEQESLGMRTEASTARKYNPARGEPMNMDNEQRPVAWISQSDLDHIIINDATVYPAKPEEPPSYGGWVPLYLHPSTNGR